MGRDRRRIGGSIRAGSPQAPSGGTWTPRAVGWPPAPPKRVAAAVTLSLRDTLSRSVRPVEPIEPGRVRMYTCGPTVYRYAHVGNLRSVPPRRPHPAGAAVPRDRRPPRQEHHRRRPPARRAVRPRRGPDARRGRARAQDRRPRSPTPTRPPSTPTRRSSTSCPAHVFPRATEHVPEMIALAERLEDAGHAYATAEGNVYYDVASFPGYGRLSGNTLDELRAGHRGEVEPDKRDPADFALWKAAGEGRLLNWPTAALGRGLPGLAPRVLGDGDALPRRRTSTSTPAASTTSSRTTRTRSPSRRRSWAAPPARTTGSTASTC